MNINKKLFPLFILLSAVGLISVAAFFSIVGISTLFAGSVISVSIMALFLELGKISAATFLYRYWTKCKTYIKTYLTVATIILMIITSLGIFGYLSAAYQKSSIEFGVTQDKIKITEQQIVFSQQNIDNLVNLRTSQNTNQMNEFVVRNPMLFKQFQQQIADTDSNIEKESKKKQALIDSVNTLKLGTAEKKDVQTFKFVADAVGLPLDTVARWFIIMIIFVFDPMAIGLILAYNVAVYRKEDESVYDDVIPILPPPTPIWSPKDKIIESEPIPSIITEPPKESVVIESKTETPPAAQNGLTDWFKQMFKF